MTIEQLRKELRQFQTAARKLLRDEMPPIIGRLAVNHYRENFRKGGFVDSALEPWPVTRRQQSGGKFAAQRYGPLLSSRSHLMKSTRYETSAFRTRVFNDVDYASIHNSGGVTHPTVTPKMRRFAWYRYFVAGGGKTKAPDRTEANETAEMWKRLALTKKTKLTVRIPNRQFIGPSAALTRQILHKGEEKLLKITPKWMKY